MMMAPVAEDKAAEALSVDALKKAPDADGTATGALDANGMMRAPIVADKATEALIVDVLKQARHPSGKVAKALAPGVVKKTPDDLKVKKALTADKVVKKFAE